MNTTTEMLDHGLALKHSLEFFSRHADKHSLIAMISANLNALYPNDLVDLTITPLTDMHLAGRQNDLSSIYAGE